MKLENQLFLSEHGKKVLFLPQNVSALVFSGQPLFTFGLKPDVSIKDRDEESERERKRSRKKEIKREKCIFQRNREKPLVN